MPHKLDPLPATYNALLVAALERKGRRRETPKARIRSISQQEQSEAAAQRPQRPKETPTDHSEMPLRTSFTWQSVHLRPRQPPATRLLQVQRTP